MQILFVFLRFYLFLFCFLLLACNRDDVNQAEIKENLTQEILYYHDTQLIGRVKNKANQPIYNAIISCNETRSNSNEDGLFLIRNTKTNKAGQLVKFSYPSFFAEHRFFISDAGDVQSINVNLTKLSSPVILNTNATEVVKLDSELDIQILPSSFMTSSGQTYAGLVKLYFRKIQSLNFVPIERINYKKQIFVDPMAYQLIALSENNEELKLKNSVKVVSKPEFVVATLNEARAMWHEEKSITLDNKFNTDINNLDVICLGKISDFTYVEAALIDEKSNILSNVLLTLEAGNNEGEMQSSQSGKLKCFFPSNVTAGLNYNPKDGNKILIRQFNLPKGNHQAGQLTLNSSHVVAFNSLLKFCGNGELTDEEMVNLWVTNKNNSDLIFYQSKINQTYYSVWEHNEVVASYYSNGKRIYSINKFNDESNKVELANDNFCISNLIGFLKIDEKTKYYNESQIQILEESNELISITDNIGFIISFINPKLNIPLNPSIVFISDPKNIVCDEGNCDNLSATFSEFGEQGSKVRIKISGTYNGYVIEGLFEGILR